MFCIDKWIWLCCTFHLSSLLVHILEFLLDDISDWHSRRYCCFLYFLDTTARVLNASLCPFPSVTIGLAGDGFCSLYIKSYAAWKVASMEDICGILNFFWKILLCLIFYLLLSWGYMPCDTCSVPFLVLCTSRLICVFPWCTLIWPIMKYFSCTRWG